MVNCQMGHGWSTDQISGQWTEALKIVNTQEQQSAEALSAMGTVHQLALVRFVRKAMLGILQLRRGDE